MSRLSLIQAIALSAFLIWWTGCDDNPTEPNDPIDNPGDTAATVDHFYMYGLINDITGDLLTTFDVPSDTILDTITIGLGFEHLAITPDKRRLYLSGKAAQTTRIYDLESSVFLTDNSWWGNYYFDGGRDIGVVVNESGIRTFELQSITARQGFSGVIDFSTIDTTVGIVYAGWPFGISLTYSYLFRYDYVADSLIDSLLIFTGADTFTYIGPMLAISGREQLYFYGSVGSNNYAVIYNTQTEQVISRRIQDQPLGSFALSPDGNFVYQSDPNTSNVFTSGWILKYDLLSGIVVDSLSTIVATEGGPITASIDPIVVTPDGNFLYSSGTTFSPRNIIVMKHVLSDGSNLFVPTGLDPSRAVRLAMGIKIPQ